jgi:prolyl-tRNA editing enzyme YbaK/EbsC (Cys-tRNA(Pro) deacylase)
VYAAVLDKARVMTDELHPKAALVAAAARAHGVEIDVVEQPESTHTAEEAAAAVGVDVAQIVKSLVFSVDGQLVLALVSGTNRLDEKRLAVAADGGVVERAAAVRDATGFAIGGIPPFGHRSPLRTYVDRTLLDHGVVWAAAGTPRHVFAIGPADLVRLSSGTVADLAR